MSRKDLLPDAGSTPLTVRQALYRASRDYKGGQFALAHALGICPDDLCKRVSLNANRPLQPDLLEEIVAETRDMRLLSALVRPAGAMVFLPRPAEAKADGLKATVTLLNKMSGYVEALADGLQDGKWERHEVDALRNRAEQLIDKVLGVLAGAEQALEDAEHE